MRAGVALSLAAGRLDSNHVLLSTTLERFSSISPLLFNERPKIARVEITESAFGLAVYPHSYPSQRPTLEPTQLALQS